MSSSDLVFDDSIHANTTDLKTDTEKKANNKETTKIVRKAGSKVINKTGKQLIHNFQKAENVDSENYSEGCLEFCRECGQCDEILDEKVTRAYHIKYKLISYYCEECYAEHCDKVEVNIGQKTNKKCDIVLYLNTTDNEKHTTVVQDKKYCRGCKKSIDNTDNFVEKHEYDLTPVCNSCVKIHGFDQNNRVEYARCKNNFECFLCAITLGILTKGDKINCKDVPRAKVHKQNQYFSNFNLS